jgi:hypothetical protein
LHRASTVSKTLFIIPTDAHYYKSVEMLTGRYAAIALTGSISTETTISVVVAKHRTTGYGNAEDYCVNIYIQ